MDRRHQSAAGLRKSKFEKFERYNDEMLFLNNDNVRQVITPELTLQALRDAYAELREDTGVCRPRIDVNIPIGRPDAFFKWGTMEGGSAQTGYFATRIKIDISYKASYEDQPEIETIEKYSTRPGKFCGLILLVKTENAEPVAIINDSVIQRLRVGADAALGTDYLARPDAEVLGILGSGGMAHTQLACTLALRKNIRKIQVFSPTPANREAFVQEIRQKYEIEAVALESGPEVFRGADIVAGCTDGGFKENENNAAIGGRWLEPGTHWTAVGGGHDSEARRRTAVALRFDNAPAPVGLDEWATSAETINYAVPADNPRFASDDFYVSSFGKGEASRRTREPFPNRIFLRDLLSGAVPGRTSGDQITFSERGNLQGAQFHAVAGKVYEAALAAGIGNQVPTDWFLQDERN